jgi:Cysteine-rich secretory protein family
MTPEVATVRRANCPFVLAVLGGASVVIATLTATLALDLNSFRAQHGRPALSPSATLSGAAHAHANDMARHLFLVIPGRGR